MKTTILTIAFLFLALFGGYALTHQQSTSFGEGSTLNNYYAVPSNASSTVGLTSSLITATTTARSYYQITNNTGGVLTISVGTPAVVGKGVVLANTGTWTMNTSKIFTAAIYGISTATGSVSILEANK